jgi:parvulin-like peptidyl-prolyl isomerase
MHLRTLAPMILLVSLALLVAGCGRQADESAGQPSAQPTQGPTEPSTPAADLGEGGGQLVARVNGRPIYREGLDDEMELVVSQYAQIYAQFGQDLRALLVGADGRELNLNLELEALNRLAGREVLLEEADKRGIQVTDEAVEARFQELYAEFLASHDMTEEEFEAYVVKAGSTMDEFLATSKQNVREQLIVEELQDAVVGPVELSDADVASYFEEHRSDYEQEEQVRASHILVKTQTEAEVVAENLRAGEDFAEAAQEYSIGPSASAGGDLGWFGRGDMVPAFEEAAFALGVGETSDVVQTEFGFHIIRVTGRKEATSPKLDEIFDQVRRDAESATSDEKFRDWYKGVYEAADVKIEDPLLDAVRLRKEDPEKGREALERLLDDDRVDDPYLPYLVGLAYEEQRQQAVNEKKKLEEGDVSDPEVAAQIADLDREIEEATTHAAALYHRALETAGEDPAIRARLAILEGSATQTPSETAP